MARVCLFGLLIAAVLYVGFGFPVVDSGSSESRDGDHKHGGSSGERLLNHILDEVDKGHVTRDRISHWMTQIREGVEDGSLTQHQVDTFMETMKAKLRTSSEMGGCCPFG